MAYAVEKSDAEWREQLTPEEYAVLRKAGTERPFTGEYTDTKTTGVYRCRACNAELFRSDTKFDSGCGWPAFYAAKAGDRVKLTADHSYGMSRVEVTCARCGSPNDTTATRPRALSVRQMDPPSVSSPT